MLKSEDRYLANKHIVLVDDEPELLSLVASVLQKEGFERLSSFDDPLAALAYCRECEGAGEAIHLFVLDVMMPGLDGFTLLGMIRTMSSFEKAPAIFLTAKDEPTDRLSGLGLGADDYIIKPFLPQELALRVTAVLRRCYSTESPTLELGHAEVNLDTAEVLKGGETVMLTAKEHEILSVLARNAGRIVTIDAICEACWGGTFGYENTLMAHIRRLREKIEDDPSNPTALVTVKGLGYKLNVGSR